MNSIWLISYLLLWVLVLVQCLFLILLMRQVGFMHLRMQKGAKASIRGPVPGESAPRIDLMTIDGQSVTVGGASGRSTLLLFMSPGCPECRELMPAVNAPSDRRNEEDVILISDESEDVLRLFRSQFTWNGTPLCHSPEAVQAFDIWGMPYFVRVDGTGNIAGHGLMRGPKHLESLLSDRPAAGHVKVEIGRTTDE